jgi:hypothetical protein
VKSVCLLRLLLLLLLQVRTQPHLGCCLAAAPKLPPFLGGCDSQTAAALPVLLSVTSSDHGTARGGQAVTAATRMWWWWSGGGGSQLLRLYRNQRSWGSPLRPLQLKSSLLPRCIPGRLLSQSNPLLCTLVGSPLSRGAQLDGIRSCMSHASNAQGWPVGFECA